MTTYNYFESIQTDVINYIDKNGVVANNIDELYSVLINSEVTGNAAGGYTDNETAASNLQDNEILLFNALEEWGYTQDDAKSTDPQTLDVFLRCHLLRAVINNTVSFLAVA